MNIPRSYFYNTGYDGCILLETYNPAEYNTVWAIYYPS